MILSLEVQNELIVLSADCLRTELHRELIGQEKFYSIIVDETSDVSGTEQLSLVVRYVSDSPSIEIKEIFLGFAPLEDLSARAIFDVLFNMIRACGLKPESIRGEWAIILLVKILTADVGSFRALMRLDRSAKSDSRITFSFVQMHKKENSLGTHPSSYIK